MWCVCLCAGWVGFFVWLVGGFLGWTSREFSVSAFPICKLYLITWMIRYKPRLLPQSEMGKHSSLAQGSRHPLLPQPSRHTPGRRRPGSGGPAGSHPLARCGDSRRIVAGRGRVERKTEPTAFLRRGTNVPWVTLAPCGPSLGFSFLPLIPNGPRVGCRDAVHAPRAGTQLGPGLARLPRASPREGLLSA